MALRYLLYVFVVAGVIGLMGVAWVAMQPATPDAPPTEAVAAPPPVVAPRIFALAAARQLRAGALLVSADLAPQEVAEALPGMVMDTPDARAGVLGGMIRHSLTPGAPLHAEDVLRSRDRGFLAAVLAPGMLAVSIGVDPVTGAAGLVWPGDRVDLVLTQANDNAILPAARRVSGETMLADLRVIAIDQQLMQGAIGSDAPDRTVRTVTLEVTSAQAERVAVGTRLGKLSLAVHAAISREEPGREGGSGKSPGVTWAGDVSAAVSGAAPTTSTSLRVYSGPEKTEEVHF